MGRVYICIRTLCSFTIHDIGVSSTMLYLVSYRNTITASMSKMSKTLSASSKKCTTLIISAKGDWKGICSHSLLDLNTVLHHKTHKIVDELFFYVLID